VKEIASASHIYGKKYVDAESWTTWLRWQNSPLALKQLVDRAFCEGLNRITYHVYPHSPKEAGFPGRSYHAGVDLNPQVVWWSKAKPFMDYLARCCYLLQQGLFAADVAYYYGDKAPNFWPPFHNVPEKPLLEGLGEGYDYDVVNTDVILNRMSVKDGLITLPDGMSYQVLVLPDERTMPLEVLVKLEKLVAAGATIVGPKPVDVPGMKDYQERAAKLRALADRMWGACDGSSVKQNNYGRGKVIWGLTSREWLLQNSVGPDFSSETEEHTSQLDYIHRRKGDTDIYFVRNKSSAPMSTWCLFRVKDKTPQLWDPMDGSVKPVFTYQEVPGGTRVRLHLSPCGSVFVVFSKKTPSPGIDLAHLSEEKHDSTLPPPRLLSVSKTAAKIRVWNNGEYELADRKGNKKLIKIDSLPEPLAVEGEWFVQFDPDWGAPPSITLPKLLSWTDHENDGVKYYSGPGFYIKTLNIPKDWLDSGRRVYLDLGEVHEVAEVAINERSAGILWTPPFQTEITSFLKPGANELKIEIRNMWTNRLHGDMKLPPEKRFCRTNIRSEWPLLPAGLLGPVRVLSSIDVTIDFSDK
ncbi:MAG: glycosyl hydrolase, partial [bacterium]